MLKDKQIIESVNNGNLRLKKLGIETTRKCQLKCRHCYKGDAQNLDMRPEVLEPVFEYFNDITDISLYGGESSLNPEGLEAIYRQLLKNKTPFEMLTVVSNGINLGSDFLDTLNNISKLGKYTITSLVSLTNDAYHDEAYKNAGIDKKQILANIETAQERYPDIVFKVCDFISNDRWLYNSGRAMKVENANLVSAAEKGMDQDMVFTKDTFRDYNKQVALARFAVDAKGNVIPVITDYVTGDANNYGNVLKTPVKQILLEQGRELC